MREHYPPPKKVLDPECRTVVSRLREKVPDRNCILICSSLAGASGVQKWRRAARG